MRMYRKKGFTIVELLTVIAIILLLVGALATSVTRARRQAKIQQAITEAQQLTDAILAYENFVRPGESESPLESKATGESWKEASRDDMKFVLGEEDNPTGQEGNIPVLFNGAVKGDSIKDPWGKPYQYRIMSKKVEADDNANADNDTQSALAIPNINRIPADEVN